jgi:DNA-binding NarL/FixJ family response regulator
MTRPRLMVVAGDPASVGELGRTLAASGAFDLLDGSGPARRPDIVVIEQAADGDVTLDRLRALRAALPDAKLIVLFGQPDRVWLSKALAAGAEAAIARSCAPQALSSVLREVAAGNVFHAFEAPLAPLRGASASPLTQRELEILRLVAAGAPNRRIAAKLWITEQTVKFHLSNVYRKLGVANRTEASHHAFARGLVDLEAGSGLAA